MVTADEFIETRKKREDIEQQLGEIGKKYEALGRLLQRSPGRVLFERVGAPPEFGARTDLPLFKRSEFEQIDRVISLVSEYQDALLKERKQYYALEDAARKSITEPPKP